MKIDAKALIRLGLRGQIIFIGDYGVKYCLAIITFLFIQSSAFANNQQCADAIRAGSLALELKDWRGVVAGADKTIAACRLSRNNEIANQLGFKVLGYAMLGQQKQGIETANKCFKTHYATPVCHYWKAVLLRDQGRVQEFNKAKVEGIAVCEAVIKTNSRFLSSALDAVDRVYLQGEIDVAKATLNNLLVLY